MKKKKREARITIETERIFVLSRRGSAIERWCDGCGEQVFMLRPEEAAVLTGISTRAIYRLIEDGLIHFVETADGLLLVCLNSLPQPQPPNRLNDLE
ncbi:MAG: hypothetical protein AB1631_05645 [Acidobacteriota bacterium]